jgi:hypothetical protein
MKGDFQMKTTLLASVAILVLGAASAQAVVPMTGLSPAVFTADVQGEIILAKRGRGGDDTQADDRGGSQDDSAVSGSGRKKPRVPGGSGCDDAGDIAEHPECTPGQ